jgi:toxin-antitoxin system PIN domain toxin
MIALLDVNTLIALGWPNHSHHDAAHEWFADWTSGWATTPITETGFVRVSSNDSVLATSVRPIDAIEHLSRLRTMPGHSFWIDAIEGVVGNDLDATRVLGHRQVSDAHLVSIAIANDGTLATFDKGMRSLVGPTHSRHITLITP